MSEHAPDSTKQADKGASALARLKTKAASCGRSYQLCLQLFCQEELLRRLAHSRYADNLILKGGLFLYTLTHYDSRVTLDIDFLLRHVQNPQEHLRAMLTEIIETDTGNNFITFEIQKMEPIALAKKYAGVGASIIARIKNTRTPIGIDFGIGDCIFPGTERHQIPTQLPGYESPEINTYPLETAVAEKLDAAMSLMMISSRMKDYHDLYDLANRFDFNGALLAGALQRTFKNRERAFDDETFADFLSLANEPSMQSKWNAYARKTGLEGIKFSSLMELIGHFLAPPYHAACAEENMKLCWHTETLSWR